MTLKLRKIPILAVALLVLSLAVLNVRKSDSLEVFGTQSAEKAVYVLDAGHGGEDGGAVSADGIRESDINLGVTLSLNSLMRFLGQNTVLTRSEDKAIYSDGANTLREKKVSDLKNRVSVVNSTPNAVLVSIHQNSLPSAPSVHGAQVFYGSRQYSDTLAVSVQSALNQSINSGNEKHEKQISPTIYLMKNANCPAVLIECGFMSNREEVSLLLDEGYQKKLAAAIAAGLLNSAETEREVP